MPHYRFGLFEADPDNSLLRRQGVCVRIQEQPLRILAALLRHPGQLVSREELRRELWPEGTHVDFEGSLNAALKRLRVALDDDPDNPRFIETVPKRGYRFIAPLALATSDPLPLPPPPPEIAIGPPTQPVVQSSARTGKWVMVLAALVGLVAVGAPWAYRRASRSSPPASAVTAAPAETDPLSLQPTDPGAARLYALGREAMRRDDAAAARDFFLQSEKLAPQFALVHVMLARAWSALGYDAAARQEAQTARAESGTLPLEPRLLVDAVYYDCLHQPQQAASVYRALSALEPANLDLALDWVAALKAANRREEGMAVLAQLRRLPPALADDARIDAWQAELLSFTSGAAARPYMDRAVRKAAARGQNLLYAHFRLQQCLSSLFSDDPQLAPARCQEAYNLYMAAGNRLQAADAMRMLADRRAGSGDFEGATSLYQRALALLQPLDDHEKSAAVRNNLAILEENQGELKAATANFEQARQDFAVSHDQLNVLTAQVNLADIRFAQGDLPGAAQQYQTVLDRLLQLNPAARSYAFMRLAGVRLAQGDPDAAAALAHQAAAVAAIGGAPNDVANAELVAGDVAEARGDDSAAQAQYQRARLTWQRLGDANAAAEGAAALARALGDVGRYTEAEALLRPALGRFAQHQNLADEVLAQTTLARVLRRQGKLAAAGGALAAASALASRVADPAVTLPLAIESARLAAAGPDAAAAAARQQLEQARRRAARLGYAGLALEAGVAESELELRTAPGPARAHLAALADSARGRGLDRIAAQARQLAALNPPH